MSFSYFSFFFFKLKKFLIIHKSNYKIRQLHLEQISTIVSSGDNNKRKTAHNEKQ